MEFRFRSCGIHEVAANSLVLLVTSFDAPTSKTLKALDVAANGALTAMARSGEFSGAQGQIVALFRPAGFQAERVILVGLGDAECVDADSYRRAVGRLSRRNEFFSYRTATIHLGNLDEATCYQAAVEGYLLGSYQLLEHKSGDARQSRSKLHEITLAINNHRLRRRLEGAIAKGVIAAEAQRRTRDLAATPANKLTPRIFAQTAQRLARTHGLDIKVLDSRAIAKERMGALMAVGQGSAEAPRFVVLKYQGGPKAQKPVVLVGKGITFDSGGLSLKKADKMWEMKGDMTGAAVVLSTVVAATQSKLKLNLVGLMPLAENMPSSKATRPGDIVTTRSGLTVEIINTDAEGRLILADALDYADEFDPQAVIDVATLTGATLYILGYSGAPILGNHDELQRRISKASKITAEKVWPLPIWDDFRRSLDSDLADLVNSAGKTAGTATAAAFLENFIGDWPWAHIDIAYVDVEPKGRPYAPRGTTGIGTRLLISLLSNWKKL